MGRCDPSSRSVSSRVFTVNLCALSLSQPRLCMATNWQQWEWAANQPRPPVASWRPVRGTRSGSCPAGSEAPRRLARRGSCSCWWRRKSAGWNGRVRCVSVTVLFLCLINVFCSFHAGLFESWFIIQRSAGSTCSMLENISGPNVRTNKINDSINSRLK